MKVKKSRRKQWLWLLVGAGTALSTQHVVRAQQAAATDTAAGMASVLGNPASWTLTPANTAVTMDGTTPLLNTLSNSYLFLDSKEPQGPMEYVMQCRLRGIKGGTASISLQVAGKTPAGKKPQSLSVGISSAGESEYVSYSTTLVHEKNTHLTGGLGFQAVTERNLAWPEEIRRTVEAQMAEAPKVADSIMTVRCLVQNRKFRTYLNGRFLNEIALPDDMDGSGSVKISMYYGSQLLSLRARPVAASNGRFEPIGLDSYVNSDRVAGKKLASLKSGQVQSIRNVPFALPERNSKGADHIDVGTSWTRFGALPGYIAANFGTFGGRWIAGNKIDPARFAMYVPTRRYKALHLLAVSDGGKDELPIVSAQFYRPDAGHPLNFTANVPGVSSRSTSSMTVKTADGKTVTLHHIVMPLDPDAFSWFTDLDRIGLEITKEVHYYRGYPDPLEYSYHGGGLPSSAQIYAMTLETEPVDIEITPDNFGHVWTAPAAPGYTMELRNSGETTQTVKVAIDSATNEGLDKSHQDQQVTLPAGGAPVKVRIPLKPTRYGLHDLAVTVSYGDQKATYRRNFAYLHEETREQSLWEDGHGPIFGFWPWGGGHVTPSMEHEIAVMGAAGAETSTRNYDDAAPAIRALAEKHRFIAESAFSGGSMYFSGFYGWYTGAPKFDPANPEASGKALVEALRPTLHKSSIVSRPTYLPFFAEPQFGTITTGIWPSHYGEDYKLSADEQRVFEDMRAKYLAGAKAIRKEWPNIKLLLPYGDPMVAASMMRLAPETRDLVDGVALDLPGFERMPEQQINQVVLNRLQPILQDIKMYKKDPYLVLIEGFCIGSKDIDTGQQGQAEIGMRDFLVLMGYGITRFESNNAPFDCANYWGENHYGAGWLSRLPLAMPKLAYTHYAALTRNLNRANFVKYVPTGSTSTYCQQFKHYKTGNLVHTLWTIRGTRPVTVAVGANDKPVLVDANDNEVPLTVKNGAVTFNLGQNPVYLHGMTGEPRLTLAATDHSDAQPGKLSVKVANFGDGSWKMSETRDDEYEKNKALQVERFITKMSSRVEVTAKEQGGKALAVHLDKPAKDRGVMPFYTTLEPKAPITIPGKASHFGLWARAASDWGRIVYVLRDAKGEKWISVGTKDDWNNDDIHAWSAFNFDGWRYMQFQLPSNLPYDSYREHGTSWWGSYGGDGIVDLPLKLQKVMVERRPKVIYGNDLVEAKSDDVLLGDLRAEYAAAADKTPEAVRLSTLRMPLPATSPEISNPIADLAKTGVGEPTKVLKVTDPSFQYDGTRAHIHFEPVTGAKSYDVWVSPYADGRGAIKLGSAWTESGQLLQGLRPQRDFYVFVVYTDANGKASKPSAPFKFSLVDRFGYK